MPDALLYRHRVPGRGARRLPLRRPPEAPTTRGFAGVLSEGLNGLSPDEVLATPDNFYEALKLGEVISPLRLRGMSAIMSRLKRQVREHQGLE